MWLITEETIYILAWKVFATKHKIGYCISGHESGLVHSLFFSKPSRFQQLDHLLNTRETSLAGLFYQSAGKRISSPYWSLREGTKLFLVSEDQINPETSH